jgi:hypothetical protein
VIDWNSYPKAVLVWLIQDYQLPIAAVPSRQDKKTLVEALERHEKQRQTRQTKSANGLTEATYKHKLDQLLKEYRMKKPRY